MGYWHIVVPEAARNRVKNPSAELAGNFGLLLTSPSVSISPSPSASPSASASISASRSTSPSASTSISPSASTSRSPSASSSPSGSTSKSASVSPSPSPSAGITAVTRSTQAARFGDYAYLLSDGMTLTLEALSNAIYSVSLYATSATSTTEVSLDGNNFHLVTVLNGTGGTWRRAWAQIPAAQANGSTTLYIRNTAGGSFLIDGLQVEESEYPTTYIDGDQGPLYRWTGLRHGSASTRDAQERGGGREMDFEDDYGIRVLEGTRRIGMPPLVQQVQALALGPGANHQGSKVLPREIELKFEYEGTGDDDEAARESFHGLRQQLIDLLKPDAVRGAQPVIIGTSRANSDRKVYARFHYVSGLEFNEFMGNSETPTVRLFAEDPFWYEDDRGTASLDFTDSVTAAYGLARLNGQWQALGSGFNEAVRAIVVDNERGRVYFGGNFTTADGKTVNCVCYWDGITFVPLTIGVTSAGNPVVYALALDAAGNLWVGGDFTSAGGATADGLARWNVATGTWTAFAEGTAGDVVYALALNSAGLLYVGGAFVNRNGNANADRIFSYDGSTFAALGTGADDEVNALAVGPDDVLYAGGKFTNIGGGAATRLAQWDGSIWTALGSGVNDTVQSLLFLPNGELVIGGLFTDAPASIRIWNGVSFRALGSGVNGNVYALAYDGALLYAGGVFTIAGGLAVADRIAAWNGYSWVHLDVDLPGTPFVYAIRPYGDDLYLGFSTTGTAAVAGLTTVTNSGTTGVFADATVLGPTSATALLQWLENQSTAERLYFNLTVNTLETIIISMQTGAKFVASLWGGRSNALWRRDPNKGGVDLLYAGQSLVRGTGLLRNQPLPASDFASWHLLPGANTVAAFVTGTTTGVVILLHWTPRHWSSDGPA